MSNLAKDGYELIIIGQHYLDESTYDVKGLRFAGRIPSTDVWNYLAEAACFVHLSWLDCCPNGVVEALAAKVPVVYCADGAAELVGDDAGFRVMDSPLNHPCDTGKPPTLDAKEVSKGIRWIVERTWKDEEFPDVSMGTCVEKYAQFLHKVRGKRVAAKQVRRGDPRATKRVVASTDNMR